MEEHDFDFIITGEVIGQRPKSQTRDKLPVVQRESGAFDRLLRPLCAKSLEPTLPEREGWVDREALGDVQGRSRQKQMEMAERFGIEDYAQPAGGCCFLTDQHYSQKLKDLWRHRESRDYDLDDIMLLKVGRHIRPNERFKMIVARDSGETNYLNGYRKQFTHLIAESHSGPLTLIQGEPDNDDLEIAARVTARYGQGRNADQVTVKLRHTDGNERLLDVPPLPPHELPEQWLV